MKNRSFIIITLLVATLALLSCEPSNNNKSETIVVTTNIIGNSIKEIVKNDVPIITLMNSEIDPHSYDASPNDYKQISNAKVVISNGLHLEGKIHEALLNTRKSGGNLILMSDGLEKASIITEEEGVNDPHIWFDVLNWYDCVSHATEELIKIYPEHEQSWNSRLDSLKAVYTDLDSEVKLKISSIPEESRYLVTAHDAFSYYSKAYGIKIKPLQGRNTNDEPSAKDIVDLSNFIIEKDIKAIFVESTVNQSFINSIVEAVKNKGGNVSIGGELYADASGKEGTPESSYSGMVKHNTNTIVNALK